MNPAPIAVTLALAFTAALAPSSARADDSPVTRPRAIEQLAKSAYAWSLAPEFVYRFSQYNNLVTAERNTLGGGSNAAAWNNNATNAGDASVVYLNAMLDLSGDRRRGNAKELVLTVPPSKSNYFVVNLLDAFINSVGSIGTRTTSSPSAQTYLLAGPTSKYAHRRVARINGFTYRVMTADTNLGWILIRARADTLVAPADPASAATIAKTVVKRFALTTLAEFQDNGHQPEYFVPGTYKPRAEQVQRAQKWHNAPTSALAFFKQAGEGLALNPLPTAKTGLNGTLLRTLPDWVVPQYGAKRVFENPSFGQARTLARFAPLGLTASGFRVPSNWGPQQLAALERGFAAGKTQIDGLLSSGSADASTNFWTYLNDRIGTYPNTALGYRYRAAVVLSGGAANVGLDAIYAQANDLDGTQATQLDGNGTYRLTFKPPVSSPATLPVVGTLPPTVDDAQGNARGFWSLHVYQTDASQSAAPFIPQATVLNTAYSHANLAVTAIDAATDTLTVEASDWGPLAASSPILFGETAAKYGLAPNVPYYVASTPEAGPGDTYSFQVSGQWRQELSASSVPIQGTNGTPGSIVDLSAPSGTIDLLWGPVQPVSQLGSQQLTSNALSRNVDGSVTIWISPTLPAGAPATNWIPTPSNAYNEALYGSGIQVPTALRAMIRIYIPTPGSNTEASILPPPNGSMPATYAFPAVERVG